MSTYLYRTRSAARRAPARVHLAAAGILLVGAAACSGSGTATADGDDRGDEPAPMAAMDSVPYTGMADLSQESDLVVHGSVAAVEPGVPMGATGASTVEYSIFTIEVDEVLAGEGADRIEVALSTHFGGREVVLEGRPVPKVGDDGVWFLTEIAPEFERDGYVLTSTESLVLEAADAEAAGEGLAEDSSLLADVEELGSLEDVVDHVRSESAEAPG